MLKYKKLKIFSILLVSGLFLMFSCEAENGKKNIRSSSAKLKFTAPSPGKKYRWGDTLHFEVGLKKNTEKEIEKLSLYINNNEVYEQAGVPLVFDYPSASGTGGQLKVKAVVKFKDGSVSRSRMAVWVLSKEKPEKLTYRVLNVYPHDPDAYTQGLEYQDGYLYEGTGNYGESHLRKVEPSTGKILKDIALDKKYFGEGITLLNDKIYQLTYKSKTGFIYNMDFEKIGEFRYNSEGWGLENNGKELIMTDGSAYLTFLDTLSENPLYSIQAFDHKSAVYKLNELAYVDGIIYANVYTTDKIVKIDAASGRVLAEIDMTGILKPEYITGEVDYLNGIAFNPDKGTFYVTGKWWPKLFEVVFEKE